MSASKNILPLAIGIALTLAGCGTYVPEIQEIPSNQIGGELLVQNIVTSIQCEVKNAITYIINQDAKIQNDLLKKGISQPRQADWLLDWGAQMQITLTVDEKTTVNPTGVYSPMQIFFLGLGANLSSEATRISTVNYYYVIRNLYHNGDYCNKPDILSPDAATGSLLIESDLKLKEWLAAIVLGHGTGVIPITIPASTTNADARNAFSHEVIFEIVTSGNITPMWKLVHATINQGGSLFSASRDRKHDLLITFGPNAKNTDSAGQTTNSLAPTAAGTFQAAQIGVFNRSQTISSGLSP